MSNQNYFLKKYQKPKWNKNISDWTTVHPNDQPSSSVTAVHQ